MPPPQFFGEEWFGPVSPGRMETSTDLFYRVTLKSEIRLLNNLLIKLSLGGASGCSWKIYRQFFPVTPFFPRADIVADIWIAN